MSRIMNKRGPRRKLPMYIDLTHFPKFVICILTFPFLIECSQSQSLNTCKRMGVSGHIPKLLGTWGLSTISLGKSVSQERKEKERNFVWVEIKGTKV